MTRSRRCEQITAFGASLVPLVKIRAQIASTSGSTPGSVGRHGGERVVERRPHHEHRRQAVGDRREQLEVLGLGDHEAAVRLLDVAQEVLAPAGVVEADDGRAGQRGAAEREEVLGDVVEQHRDVRRPTRREPLPEEVRVAARLRDVLGVGPDPVLEPDRGPVPDRGIGRVAAQERGRVRGRERRLTGRGDRARDASGGEPDIGVTLGRRRRPIRCPGRPPPGVGLPSGRARSTGGPHHRPPGADPGGGRRPRLPRPPVAGPPGGGDARRVARRRRGRRAHRPPVRAVGRRRLRHVGACARPRVPSATAGSRRPWSADRAASNCCTRSSPRPGGTVT